MKRFGKKRTDTYIGYSPAADVWFRFRKNKTAVIGLVVVCFIIFMALTADIWFDYDTDALLQHPEIRMQGASLQHILGTDAFGRDMLARVVYGARYSLAFAFVCTAISIIGGLLIGAAAAYIGGKVDDVIMRILDAFMCLPGILVSLTLVSAMGAGLKPMIIALSISSIPGFARLTRSVMLGIVGQEYIRAAKVCGLSGFRIVIGHVIPNAIGIVIVNAAMNISGLIMAAASLSYIGMGIQPPSPEWGAMLSEGQAYMRTYPHMVFVPGIAILITALSFNLLGDGLSEALDPRMKD